MAHWPILPVPSTPTVFPCMSKPVRPVQHEIAGPVAGVRMVQSTIEHHHQRHGELGDRIGRIGRHAHDVELVLLTGLQVDVVEACGPQRNQFHAQRRKSLHDLRMTFVVDEDAGDLRTLRRQGSVPIQRRTHVMQQETAVVGRIERFDIACFRIKQSDTDATSSVIARPITVGLKFAQQSPVRALIETGQELQPFDQRRHTLLVLHGNTPQSVS